MLCTTIQYFIKAHNSIILNWLKVWEIQILEYSFPSPLLLAKIHSLETWQSLISVAILLWFFVLTLSSAGVDQCWLFRLVNICIFGWVYLFLLRTSKQMYFSLLRWTRNSLYFRESASTARRVSNKLLKGILSQMFVFSSRQSPFLIVMSDLARMQIPLIITK